MLPHLLTYSCRETLNDVAKTVGNVGVRQFLILHLRAEDTLLTMVFLSIHVLVHLFFHPKLDIISEHGDIISEQVVIISELTVGGFDFSESCQSLLIIFLKVIRQF